MIVWVGTLCLLVSLSWAHSYRYIQLAVELGGKVEDSLTYINMPGALTGTSRRLGVFSVHMVIYHLAHLHGVWLPRR